MSKIYALLVGINDYPAEVGSLGGCLNDVDDLNAYLEANLDKSRGGRCCAVPL